MDSTSPTLNSSYVGMSPHIERGKSPRNWRVSSASTILASHCAVAALATFGHCYDPAKTPVLARPRAGATMTKRTKQSDDEIIEAFYGINLSTFEVERVSLTRGGTLSKSTKDGGSFQYRIEHGRQARNEVTIVFNLTDIFPVY